MNQYGHSWRANGTFNRENGFLAKLSRDSMAFVRSWMGRIAILMAFSGCATVQTFTVENPYGTLEGAQEGEIFHLPTGIRVTEQQLLDMITGSRIIYIGETHDNVCAHQVQLEIIRGLAERFPGQVAVGMEMFQRPHQEAMDRWSRGGLSERDFLKKSGWYQNWGMDYRYYKAILDYIREEHIHLLALNASRELVKEVRTHGLDGLSETWQNQLPDMDFSDPHHRRVVEAFYKAHPPTSAKSFETFYQAHVLWDETMAETVANYLTTSEGSDKRLVVLAGGNHVRYGFGIPRRVFRRLPVAYTIVLPRAVSIPEDKRDRLMDVSLPEIPLAPANFLWIVTYRDLERVRLGVMIEEAGETLRVTKVSRGSLAAETGIQPGDLLVSFDGEDLRGSFDLLYLLGQKRPGDRARILIQRGDRSLEMTIRFQASH
jgi:uncharacterized iron-regulated protein